jgi:hypothetical protein
MTLNELLIGRREVIAKGVTSFFDFNGSRLDQINYKAMGLRKGDVTWSRGIRDSVATDAPPIHFSVSANNHLMD